MDEVDAIKFLDPEDFDLPSLAQPSIDEVLKTISPTTIEDIEIQSTEKADSTFDFESFCMRTISNRVGDIKETFSDQTFMVKPLEPISQILNQHMKYFNVGNLESLLKTENFYIIGTSHGYIIIFDSQQRLKTCFGSIEETAIYGAITCLDVDHQEELLVAGHSLGFLTVWSLSRCKLVKRIDDFLSLKQSIVSVKFSSNPKVIFMTDCQGSLFEIIFLHAITTSQPRIECLHSGFNGQISTVEPLIFPPSNTNWLKKHFLLAVAAVNRNSVLRLSDSYKPIMTYHLEAGGRNMPLVRWIVPEECEFDTPVKLIHGKNDSFFLLSVQAVETRKRGDNVIFTILKQFYFPYSACFLTVVNDYSVFVLDSMEVFHHVDYSTSREISSCNARSLNIVYQSNYSNDNSQIKFVNQACFSTFALVDGKILCLGRNLIYSLEIYTTKERIYNLINAGKPRQALLLAVANYKGREGPWLKNEEIMSPKEIGNIISQSVLVMYKLCPTHGNISQLQEFYYDIVPFAITCCLSTNTLCVLFGTIYELFSSDSVSLRVYLDCLDNYILNKHIESIPVEIMQNFLDYYTQVGLIKELEECLINLNINSFDIDKAMKFAWKYEAYSVMIYIYNEALGDFITPAKILMEMLHKNLADKSVPRESVLSVGNKTLLYFSTCLTGKKYPYGYIDCELVRKVKDEIFRYLIVIKENQNSVSGHKLWKTGEKVLYPNLRILLRFDTHGFFNVLSIAFEDEEFQKADRISKRQIMVDILFSIMVEMDLNYSTSDLAIYFTFVAQQLAKSPGSLFISRSLLDQVLRFLTVQKFEDGQHYGRQQALLNLIESDEYSYFSDDVLLEHCWNAKFYEICEMILKKNLEYSRMFYCYLLDDLRKGQVFEWINEFLFNESVAKVERVKIKENILKNVKSLFGISPMVCTKLLLFELHLVPSEIVEMVRDDEVILLSFFDHFCEIREREILSTGLIHWTRKFSFDNLEEIYFELLCKQRPDDVLNHLKSGRIPLHNFDAIFALARKFSIPEAQSFLYEKIGSIEKGYDVLEKVLNSELTEIYKTAFKLTKDREFVLPSSLNNVILYLARNSRVDQAKSENMWFKLFSLIYSLPRASEDQIRYSNFCFNALLNSLTANVSFTAIFRKLLSENWKEHVVGSMKSVLGNVFSLCAYERKSIEIYNKLINSNLHGLAAKSEVSRKRAVFVGDVVCHVCRRRTESGVEVYSCGHVLHAECAGGVSGGGCVECGVEVDNCDITDNYF